ncbi:uncharacterized protein LOC128682022 [Plodia interpunctella]|uniref:uncharacterized protein LOC128682022 n=1 Tax=Plodia interpunctella TaxID=58824 RepID=UPI0023684993|nr:uncharacterized protein LOC128682022 [Plodia interpunctella]XP_053622452.1 uncharacterized protein LOC128682022 [Plodia interpunctella]
MILRTSLFLLSLALEWTFAQYYEIGPKWDYPDKQVILYTNELIKSAVQIIYDTDEQIERTAHLRLNSIRSIPYEVGYIMHNIQEEYRRMVDKYHTCYQMGGRLYLHEYMFYLEDIEYHFWKIEHLAYMLHEVERKYGMRGNTLEKEYVDPSFNQTRPKFMGNGKNKSKYMMDSKNTNVDSDADYPFYTVTKEKRKKVKWKDRDQHFLDTYKTSSTTRKKQHEPWYKDYGWEIWPPWNG